MWINLFSLYHKRIKSWETKVRNTSLVFASHVHYNPEIFVCMNVFCHCICICICICICFPCSPQSLNIDKCNCIWIYICIFAFVFASGFNCSSQYWNIHMCSGTWSMYFVRINPNTIQRETVLEYLTNANALHN